MDGAEVEPGLVAWNEKTAPGLRRSPWKNLRTARKVVSGRMGVLVFCVPALHRLGGLSK